MLILIVVIALTAVAYLMCSKENYILHPKRNNLFILIPVSLSFFLYLSFFSPLFSFVFLIMFVLAGFLVIKKYEEFLTLFFSNKIENLILIVTTFSIIGTLLIDIALYNKHLSQAVLIGAFVLGAILSISGRLGYIAISTYIAKKKNRSEYLGLLGFLGILGVVILCMVKKK
ncbi:hypothetical protein [Caminibacter pacificus]|uniref:Uncharacterized protein n=1 Tax=Caminibacter pacificus TaxID=1424653 RepID=A0AAJ4RD33_9BACT|nr:hypothetical protein [Caminibacter pacificus]NPA88063.1 hypothetical protein [Campylobacterota bacterium]QCI28639.1 hypothetical protein C6V80_06565 [Caminibacter pacificus]ROR40632.1 hypothetical protein EDC58_0111 [Caminibacter pacificus]